MSARTSWLTCLAFLVVLTASLWLRWPTLGATIWNVDEGIHAATARILLDGGMLYRDAIDQRTPLTYYVVAGLFAVIGESSLWSMHLSVAVLIALTAWWLYLAARNQGILAGGIWAAGLYLTLATALLYPGDAFAFNTEWFVAFFTAAAAWVFWGDRGNRSGWRLAITGALLALAFLSKQPALLDVLPPALTLAYLAWRDRPSLRDFTRQVIALGLGWMLPVLCTLGWLFAHGALSDAIYYAWTYNLTTYGPEITTGDRLLSLGKLGQMIWDSAPVVFAPLVALLGLAAYRLPQRQSTPEEQAWNPFACYVLTWLGTSVAGAMSGGRGFDHYFIQCLPPLTLAAGLGLAAMASWVSTFGPRLRWSLIGLGTLAVAVPIGHQALIARSKLLPPDSSLRTSQYVKERTARDERIFVWGFHPDIYLYADRLPASRYLYCTFQTGMVPWTNVAPDRDTAYAVTPGAMDQLLADLAKRRPAFVIDCSAGPNRHWQKYPLANYPALQEFVSKNYVLADPDIYLPQGYAVYLIRDEARAVAPARPAPRAVEPDASRPAPEVHAPMAAGFEPIEVLVQGRSGGARLCGLELLVDGVVREAVSIAPASYLSIRPRLTFGPGDLGRVVLQARAYFADGTRVTGAPAPIEISSGLVPREQLPAYGLAFASSRITPTEVKSLHGASTGVEQGRPVYSVHAPGVLSYPCPPTATGLRGNFGFRGGAYAASNPNPTDGAEFRVELVKANGTRLTLFRRLLRPHTDPVDRGMQQFAVAWPDPGPIEDARLELVITAGESGNASSDWTYWADLLLETSH